MTVTYCKCRYAHPIFALPESQWGEHLRQIPESCERADCGDARGCREVCREYARALFTRHRAIQRLNALNRKRRGIQA